MMLLSTRTDPIVLDIGADWRVLAFQASTLVLTTIAFALAPALGASRRARARLSAGSPRAASASRCVSCSLACRSPCL